MGAVSGGGRETLTVGGRVFYDLENLIIISAYASGTSRYSTMANKNSSSGYQVPTGKKLVIYALKHYNSVVLSWFDFGYADNDVGFYTSTVPTNVVSFLNRGNFAIEQYSDEGSAGEVSCHFEIPVDKYPCQKGNNSNTINLYAYGYLVDV